MRNVLVLIFGLLLSGCEAIGDIFQAGMAVGVAIVVLVLAVLFAIVKKFRGRGP